MRENKQKIDCNKKSSIKIIRTKLLPFSVIYSNRSVRKAEAYMLTMVSHNSKIGEKSRKIKKQKINRKRNEEKQKRKRKTKKINQTL